MIHQGITSNGTIRKLNLNDLGICTACGTIVTLYNHFEVIMKIAVAYLYYSIFKFHYAITCPRCNNETVFYINPMESTPVQPKHNPLVQPEGSHIYLQ